MFRARGIRTPGPRVYHPKGRADWLAQLPGQRVQFRAETLYAELDVLLALRPKAKTVLLSEAKRDPASAVFRTIPFLGPVRVALLLATMQTPWRFRTKRNLWAYAGLAVVTRSSADYALVDGRMSVDHRTGSGARHTARGLRSRRSFLDTVGVERADVKPMCHD